MIPLSKSAVELFRGWQNIATRKAPEDFIFCTRDGKSKEPRQIIRDHIAPACTALGFPHATWLTFRRTFSTWADQNGVSAKQRGELMGNSAEINANVYTQVTDEGLRLAVERVGKEVVSTEANDQLFTNCSLSSEWVN